MKNPLDELLAAKPEWSRDTLGVGGNRQELHHEQSRIEWPKPETTPPFISSPPSLSDPVTPSTSVGTGSASNISFILSDASEGDVKKVAVIDGKINGTFPDGMGTDDFVLGITDPADSIIYAMITFDPETLAITSRSMGVSTAAAFPDSRVDEFGGFAYWQIGFTWVDADGSFRILNTRVGDINFEFAYGALNGKPALIPVDTGPGWIDLEALFP